MSTDISEREGPLFILDTNSFLRAFSLFAFSRIESSFGVKRHFILLNIVIFGVEFL